MYRPQSVRPSFCSCGGGEPKPYLTVKGRMNYGILDGDAGYLFHITDLLALRWSHYLKFTWLGVTRVGACAYNAKHLQKRSYPGLKRM